MRVSLPLKSGATVVLEDARFENRLVSGTTPTGHRLLLRRTEITTQRLLDDKPRELKRKGRR